MEGGNASRGTGEREAERQWLLYFGSLKLTRQVVLSRIS